MVQKEVKKKTRIYGASAVLLATVLVSMVYVIGSSPLILPSGSPAVGGMMVFSSNQELVNYLNTANNGQYPGYYGGALDARFLGIQSVVPTGAAGTTGATKGSESSNSLSAADHSTTNIQVQGVDEADTVKNDGQYIYTISNQYSYYDYSSSNTHNVYIVSADTQNPKVVAKINLGNDTQPAGLFLSSDSSKLVVIASKYQTYYATREDIASSEPAILPYYSSNVYTFLYVYDISNKAQPTLTRNFTATGSYFNSRMIGDNVYAIVSQTAWVYNDLPSVPKVYDDGVEYAASPTSIYYADNNDTSYSFTSFYGLNVKDDAASATNMTVLMGGASAMYVSPSNIYITYSGWDETTGQYNAIYRVAINGLQLSLQAQGSVPGYIINQYAMDEYNGYFRVATNYWSYKESTSSQINNVYVLNQNLAITGKLEGLAPNENLHSARFMGNKCYLVTYQSVDPLFVIDLSDTTNPKVLGELKIPGYSDYLHPYDETHLIGVGKDSDLTDDDTTAYYQGIKIALFDVSNVNKPTEISNVVIGDRGTQSEALDDPKAFLFDKSKNLLVIPISLAVVSEQDKAAYGSSAYGQTVWQGAYVYTITENGLQLRGTVTHLNATQLNAESQLKEPNSYWETQNQWITRSLYIGNTLYTISSGQIKLSNLSDLSAIATVNLA
jgi:uncharacterized secreted protein with C-terminal beta-propeller domain